MSWRSWIAWMKVEACSSASCVPVSSDLEHAVVVEVEARDRVVRAGCLRLLLEADGAAVGGELDDAVALRVAHAVGEDGGAALAARRVLQQVGQVVAVEDVVAEREGRALLADEIAADQERLRQAARLRLHGPGEPDAEPRAVAQQAPKAVLLVRCGDHQHVADARQHQGAERVVDHRLVVDRDQLLGDAEGDRVQSRAGTAGQDDAFHVRRG
jgi:hypothetical protein